MQMHMTYIDRGEHQTDFLVAGSKEGRYAASFNSYRVKPKTRPEEPRTILSIGWLHECYDAKKVSSCWLWQQVLLSPDTALAWR